MDFLSNNDKVKIFVSLIMLTDIKIIYKNGKLVITLHPSDVKKINTYIKNKPFLIGDRKT